MNFNYSKTNFYHQLRSDKKASSLLLNALNQNLLFSIFFTLLIILQSVTLTKMENNNHNLMKTNGDSGNNNNKNNTNNQTINIECPDFHESSACPCYKFDDGKFFLILLFVCLCLHNVGL
jgi:hypothetical protein